MKRTIGDMFKGCSTPEYTFAVGAFVGCIPLALPGYFAFGVIGVVLMTLVVVASATELARRAQPTFQHEGFIASAFVGACIGPLSVSLGMGAAGTLGLMPLSPLLVGHGYEGAIIGLFAVIPSVLMGAVLGLMSVGESDKAKTSPE